MPQLSHLVLGVAATLVVSYVCYTNAYSIQSVQKKFCILYKSLVASKIWQRKHAPLLHFQSGPHLKWVSVAGTIFDVSSDTSILFDRVEGSYTHWIGHDITKLIILSSVDFTEYKDEERHTFYDCDVPFSIVDPTENSRYLRRYQAVQEWYERFHARYPVIGQLSDRFTEKFWDITREKWSYRNLQPKCPFGFKSKPKTAKKVVKTSDKSKTRYVHFYGKCYDVSSRSEFAENGSLAHFVSHDITYAILEGSTLNKDLDKLNLQLNFNQQVALEEYRISLEKDCAELIFEDPYAHTPSLFPIIASGDVDALAQALASRPESVHERCIHSNMTPLHRAIECNESEMVKLLLSYEADRNATAELYDHISSLELAQRLAGKEIQELLK